MLITANLIIKIAGVIGALGVIFGVIFGIYNWYLKQQKQAEEIKFIKEEEIKSIKEEQTLIIYGLSACLDGLQQLGCNHTVPVAKDKIDKHINIKAHK